MSSDTRNSTGAACQQHAILSVWKKPSKATAPQPGVSSPWAIVSKLARKMNWLSPKVSMMDSETETCKYRLHCISPIYQWNKNVKWARPLHGHTQSRLPNRQHHKSSSNNQSIWVKSASINPSSTSVSRPYEWTWRSHSLTPGPLWPCGMEAVSKRFTYTDEGNSFIPLRSVRW